MSSLMVGRSVGGSYGGTTPTLLPASSFGSASTFVANTVIDESAHLLYTTAAWQTARAKKAGVVAAAAWTLPAEKKQLATKTVVVVKAGSFKATASTSKAAKK